MKRVNNKGFAISTMLYGLLIVIVLVMGMIMSIMAFNRKNSREFSTKAVEDLEKETLVPLSEAVVSLSINQAPARYYRSLSSALQWLDSSKKAEIKFIKDVNENIQIDNKQFEAIIDLNDKTLNGYISVGNKNSSLTLNNGRIVSTTGKVSIKNNGTININNVNVTANNARVIENSGVISISSGTYTSNISDYMINNVSNNNDDDDRTATIAFQNTDLTTSTGAIINNKGNIAITGGKISSFTADSTKTVLNNEKSLSLTNATVTSNATALISNSGDSLKIENGSYTTNLTDQSKTAIDNKGVATISGATINSRAGSTIENSKTLVISSGVYNNTAGGGNVIKTTSGNITLNNSTYNLNNSSNDGIAIVTAVNSLHNNINISNVSVYSTGAGIELNGNYSNDKELNINNIVVAKNNQNEATNKSAISNNLGSKNLYVSFSTIAGLVSGKVFAVSQINKNTGEYMVSSYNTKITHSKVWTKDESKVTELTATLDSDSYNNTLYSSKFKISDFESYKGVYNTKFIEKVVKENPKAGEDAKEDETIDTDTKEETEETILGQFSFNIS